MQEKIYEDSKHIGEDDGYQILVDNIDAYEIFMNAIDEIANASNIEDFSKEDLIESLNYELNSLKEVLR